MPIHHVLVNVTKYVGNICHCDVMSFVCIDVWWGLVKKIFESQIASVIPLCLELIGFSEDPAHTQYMADTIPNTVAEVHMCPLSCQPQLSVCGQGVSKSSLQETVVCQTPWTLKHMCATCGWLKMPIDSVVGEHGAETLLEAEMLDGGWVTVNRRSHIKQLTLHQLG